MVLTGVSRMMKDGSIFSSTSPMEPIHLVDGFPHCAKPRKDYFKIVFWGDTTIPSASLWVTWKCPDPVLSVLPKWAPPSLEMTTVTVVKLLGRSGPGLLCELLHRVL